MVTAAARSVALVIGPVVNQHGVEYILPAVLLAGMIQILFGLSGMARLMRFILHAVMTGFVNAPGILIFLVGDEGSVPGGLVTLALTPPKWRKAAIVTAKTASPAQEK
ncbi:Sulfate permease family protein [Kosakonia sacchari]|nr:Sulfate permease family protein [Kosakonia sacchari]